MPSQIARVLLLLAAHGAALGLDAPPPIVANQNHVPAGILRDGVLTVQLVIGRGEWHPTEEEGMALSVYAFGEAGHSLQNPGPLIRVPQGTEVHASVRNTLDVPITVHGLGDASVGDAILQVAPQATTEVQFKATTPGLFFYWGGAEVADLKLRYGIDSELTGALVVDPPGADTNDEIFVMEMMSERAGLSARETLATINGKSWPFTQRFQYDLGQQVHWRWINATNEPHALHLHGFYFRIDAFNHGGRIEHYEPEARPMAVTQRIAQGETFDMSWAPTRPGRWLFHCHMFVHMTPPKVPRVPGLSMRSEDSISHEHAATNDAIGMGQLVLGVTVPEAAKIAPIEPWHADRKLQLEISQREEAPRYVLHLREDPSSCHSDAERGGGICAATLPSAPLGVPRIESVPSESAKPGLIGPPIILTRDQSVEISIVNNLKQPTAIHWHGIELESYYDGVPGWTGTSAQTTPPIPPGASFVARMNPPRAGTFIYHTHWHDESQLTNGLYGPLIVLPPGQKYDLASDLIFVFSIGDFGLLKELALINGTPQSKTLRLEAGTKYRFRLINISTNNQGMQVSLRDPNGVVDWRITAKDGADLPPGLVRSGKAQLTVTVGETYDAEFATATPKELLLDLLLPGQKIHTTQTLLFVSAGKSEAAR